MKTNTKSYFFVIVFLTMSVMSLAIKFFAGGLSFKSICLSVVGGLITAGILTLLDSKGYLGRQEKKKGE